MLTKRLKRCGFTLIYLLFAWFVLLGIALLAVDLGHVSTVKTALGIAADAAARNAASYLTNGDSASIIAAAKATASANVADGTPVVLSDSDIEIGQWDELNSVFVVTSPSVANAVRVTARRTGSSGVPLSFGSVFGMGKKDLSATSTVTLDVGSGSSATRVEGGMNLWLAGMPDGPYGGSANSGTAPANSPRQMTGLTLTAGALLNFSVTGSTADDPVNINQHWTPDGDPNGIRTNDSGYLNGMANLKTRQAALIGVFLDNNAPTVGGTPATLDMSSNSSRDYSTLSPLLKQPFFIGDGLKNDGTQQKVVVPTGATRLFVGTHDNVNWANNSGYYMITANGKKSKIKRVR